MADDVREVEVGTVRLREDGIVHFVSRDGAELDGPTTQELFAAYESLDADPPLLVLSDIRGVRSSTAESRAMATTPEATALHRAAAVIVGSGVTRFMGNLFMRLNRPAYPTRLFTQESAAVAWLLSLREPDGD